jgi:serine protease Do
VKDEYTIESGLKQIRKITAVLSDGRRFPARLVSYDPHLSVAYVKAEVPADAAPLPVLTPAAADTFREGRFALALGNPFGEKPLSSPLLTVGILSKVHAATQPYAWRKNWQTDASATDANCGGAVVSLRGELYGMMQIWDPRFHGRASGIGFVVPWSEIEAVLPALRQGKAWKRAYLGITSDASDRTPRITKVEPRSPAAAAGLQANDRIVAVDGFTPKDVDQMLLALRYRFAGDRVRLTVERAGEKKPLDILVTLGERPNAPADEGQVPSPAAAPAVVPTSAGAEKPPFEPPPAPPAPGDPVPPAAK